jgi:hypothetical protein
MPWGLALHNLKVAAVPVVLYGCVVAMKNPQVPFLHIATSFSLSFPAVMLFAGLLWGFFRKVLFLIHLILFNSFGS